MNPEIKILGVGGSGGNTVSRIAKFNVQKVELIAINTDAQALHFCKVPKKILIGKNITDQVLARIEKPKLTPERNVFVFLTIRKIASK